jgi:hypothetical protein
MPLRFCGSCANASDGTTPRPVATTGEDLVVAVFDALEALHVPFMLSGSREQLLRCVPGHIGCGPDARAAGLPIQALAEQRRDTFVIDASLAFEA